MTEITFEFDNDKNIQHTGNSVKVNSAHFPIKVRIKDGKTQKETVRVIMAIRKYNKVKLIMN
jgi:hypothetical protein